jgi:hypothetical protein
MVPSPLIGQKFNFPKLQGFSVQSAVTAFLVRRSRSMADSSIQVVRFADFCVENW